jgi:hypothetical protein
MATYDSRLRRNQRARLGNRAADVGGKLRVLTEVVDWAELAAFYKAPLLAGDRLYLYDLPAGARPLLVLSNPDQSTGFAYAVGTPAEPAKYRAAATANQGPGNDDPGLAMAPAAASAIAESAAAIHLTLAGDAPAAGSLQVSLVYALD